MSLGRTPPPHHQGWVTSRGDTSIYWQSWLPGPLPKAALVFVHGLAEHSGRYGYPVLHFTRVGFACYAFDLRGHGQSEGLRVHVQNFDDYDADVAAVLREVRERHPGLPVVLVGHSMGGLVALRYALSHAHELQALIVSSPALEAHPRSRPPQHLVRLARVVSLIWPTLMFKSNLDAGLVSRDPAIVEAYRKDPLVTNRVSARWFTSIVAAQQDAFVRAGNLSTPTLLMQSGGDQLVDPAATARWAELAAPELVSFYTWPDFYHEMFNEPERARVFQRMENWLATWLASPLES